MTERMTKSLVIQALFRATALMQQYYANLLAALNRWTRFLTAHIICSVSSKLEVFCKGFIK